MTLWIIACGAMIVIPRLGLKTFYQQGILDRPWKDVPARPSVPNFQGVVLIVAVWVVLGVMWLIHDEVWTMLIATSLLSIVVLVDDILHRYRRISLPSRLRLVLQISIVSVTVVVGGLGNHIMIAGQSLSPLIGTLLAIGWIVSFINCINRSDGVYGMASGVSSIGYMSIWLLLLWVVIPHYTDISIEKLSQITHLWYTALRLAGIACIYTIIEWKPRWVVRDVGTTWYGFTLGYLTLVAGAKIGLIIIVLSLPIFDSIWVVINRIIMKKSPLHGDFTHLHHRLLRLGWSRTEIRVVIWCYTLVMTVLVLIQGVDGMNKLILFGMMAMIFFGSHIYLYRYKKLPFEYIVAVKE